MAGKSIEEKSDDPLIFLGIFSPFAARPGESRWALTNRMVQLFNLPEALQGHGCDPDTSL
jgi:hypothetical protein